MKPILISLGIASLVAVLVWLAIVVFASDMYVEKAGNLIVLAFLAAAAFTSLVLMRRARK